MKTYNHWGCFTVQSETLNKKLLFKHRLPFKPLVGILVLTLASALNVACSANGSSLTPTPHPHQEELSNAFREYFSVWQEANLRSDSSRLSEVAADPVLEGAIQSIEVKSGLQVRTAEEIDILSFEIVNYNGREAIVHVKYRYGYVTLDPETRERTTRDRWYFHTTEVLFIMDDGVWKISNFQTIGWSD